MSYKGTSPNPGPTAVYRLFDDEGQLLYIGVSNNPPVRWSAHARERRWWKDVTRKAVAWYPTRQEAEAVEGKAVPEEKPLYNIAHTPLHRRLSEWYCRNHLTEDEWAAWRAADTLGAQGALASSWYLYARAGEPTGVGVPGRKPKKASTEDADSSS